MILNQYHWNKPVNILATNFYFIFSISFEQLKSVSITDANIESVNYFSAG